MFKTPIKAISGIITGAVFLNLALLNPAFSQPKTGLSNEEIKTVVNRALATFNTPGMSVGIVHQGKVTHLAGYGIKNIETKEKVNKDTLFRLASTSKAFTAASLAILVDEGKIAWQDKVTDYLPEFKMADHWVTGEFTIIDLLTHKSGLVSSAGDSMLWPEPSGFTRQEIINNLRYLTPEYSFRSKYAYSNLMYITAGELVARVTGQSWESFVGDRIFKPLAMPCFAGDMPKKSLNNIAMPHGYRDGGLYTIPRNGINGPATVSAAAGGVVCNATGMVQWLQLFLNEGVNKNLNSDLNNTLNNNKDEQQVIFTPEQLSTMWTSITQLPLSKEERTRDNSHFKTYGLGWRKVDVLGFEMISHTGTVSGMQAFVALIPELELGVVLLNNGSNSGARSSVMQSIIKSYMPNSPKVDWISDYKQEREQKRQKYLAKHKTPQGSGKVLLNNKAYSGSFEDNWYGAMNIVISEQGEHKGKLRITVPKMVTLKGTLEPFNDHSFVIRWDNKNAMSDTFIHFKTNVSGMVESFVLRPFKVKESINHNWRDMFFQRVNNAD